MIGTRLGHYRVLAPLGAGGMGVVYRAHDEKLQRDVAIKLVQPDSGDDTRARVRLLREARLASALQHANICTIFEVGEDGPQSYIVMEWVRGQTLAELLRAGPLDAPRLYRLGSQIAGAMAHAHTHHVVHRDLKCLNVMVTEAGEAKVLDFGLARRQLAASAGATESVTATAGVAGTPAYMAPETLLGREPDTASDVWSLGVVLYEMASGTLPFPGKTWYELSTSVIHGSPAPLPSHVPAPLRTLIERCLDKDRTLRIASAEDVRSALESLAAGSTPAQLARPRSHRAWVGIAIGLAVAIVTVATLLPGRRHTWLQWPLWGGAIRSIAVLPLRNTTGDPQQEYFADGLTDELINSLARVAALHVISRTSVMQFRDTKMGAREIAKELGVDAILEGSVARSGNQVRISAMLIRGDNARSIWANEYHRQMSDVLALQGEVAIAVASQVRIALTPAQKSAVARSRAVNPDAYEALLRGRHAFDGQTVESARLALSYFERALRLDPGMAAAQAGIADCYSLLGDFEGDRAYRRLARAAALRAIALDDLLADGHAVLGELMAVQDHDWEGSDRELVRAIALGPSDSRPHLWLALNLRRRGEVKRDREETRIAISLDPLNRFATAQPGWVELFARRYMESVEEFETVLKSDSTLVQAREGLGLALLQLHRHDEAIRELTRAAAIAPVPFFLAPLGHALAVAGRTREAEAILDTLQTPRPGFRTGAGDLAIVQLGLGRRAEALKSLAAAVDDRSEWIDLTRVDPRLDPLRSEPEFQRVLERLHLSDRDVGRTSLTR